VVFLIKFKICDTSSGLVLFEIGDRASWKLEFSLASRFLLNRSSLALCRLDIRLRVSDTPLASVGLHSSVISLSGSSGSLVGGVI
jgi:hypothetical protein